MFVTELRRTGELAKEIALRACWAQWSATGSIASGGAPPMATSMIDPEALLQLSLHLVEDERRLADLVYWWAEVGAGLTSLGRFRSVSERFPSDSGQRAFRQFAFAAAEAGDPRWEGHAGAEAPVQVRTRRVHPALKLSHPGMLWLRLRAAFGVGAKSDVLAFLLGLRGTSASVREIARAIDYTVVTVRKALGDMALAGLVREWGRPARYSVSGGSWVAFLTAPAAGRSSDADLEVAAWRNWAEVFAYLAHVRALSRDRGAPEVGSRVLASRARDVLERFGPALVQGGVNAPNPVDFPGPGALECLHQSTAALSDWLERNV